MASAVPPFGVLDFVRSALAFAAFLFLPGWLFFSAWAAKNKKVFALPETIAASVFASVVFLSLLSIALAFTVGVNFYSVLACELVLIGGLWFWKKRK